ncbi:MAG: HAMP domain-containing histidine kinase [Gracilibacteraceae bacterium]|jgi:two-component system OmpR family sensor kinase|nr:HAMP domain-containing histidine kinase [Gracilibacteraceae bacterium]
MSGSAFVGIRENGGDWRKSLSGQLLMRFVICIFIFFVVVGLMQYGLLKRALYSNLEQTLESTVMAHAANIGSWFEAQPALLGFQWAELAAGVALALYNTDGSLQAVAYANGTAEEEINLLSSAPSFDPAQAAVERRYFTLRDRSGMEYMALSRAVSADQTAILQIIAATAKNAEWVRGYAVICMPLSGVKLILFQNYTGYVFSAVIVLFASIIVTYFAVSRPLKPLTAISETARQITRGHYHARIPEVETTTSEIDQLCKTLNHMMEQVEMALIAENHAKERMARFIGDASHELKTPLTSIRGYLEILRRGGQVDADALSDALRAMYTETERLIRLTEALLTLNQISVYAPTQSDVGVALREVVDDSMPLILSLLGDRTLRLNGEPLTRDSQNPALEIRFPLRRDEMKQVLYNLVNNAIQYTELDGLIEITAAEESGDVLFAVQDNGLGIAAEDIPFVFDRFFRGERSRRRKAGQGAGLGLSIVAEITRIRGGKISVKSEVGQGAMFMLRFRQKGRY